MRRLLFIVAVIYAVAVLADGVSTIIMMNVETPSNVEIRETHPLGYPTCLITAVLYPAPFLVAGFISTKIYRGQLKLMVLFLTMVLAPILTIMIVITLAAVANNIAIINTWL